MSVAVTSQARTVFQEKQGKKTIDVYWLSDDGGPNTFSHLLSLTENIFIVVCCFCSIGVYRIYNFLVLTFQAELLQPYKHHMLQR